MTDQWVLTSLAASEGVVLRLVYHHDVVAEHSPFDYREGSDREVRMGCLMLG